MNLIPFVTGKNRMRRTNRSTGAGPQHAIRRGNYKLRQQARGDAKLFDVVADVAEQKDLSGSALPTWSKSSGGLCRLGPGACQASLEGRPRRSQAERRQTRRSN